MNVRWPTMPTALSGARAIEDALGRYTRSSHTTPAGLPKGYQWKPHDTGKLGQAAARRRRQMDHLAAKPGGARG